MLSFPDFHPRLIPVKACLINYSSMQLCNIEYPYISTLTHLSIAHDLLPDTALDSWNLCLKREVTFGGKCVDLRIMSATSGWCLCLRRRPWNWQ